MNFALQVAPAHGAGEDRANVVTVGDGLLLVLADGAGGTSGGAAAADGVVSMARDFRPRTAEDCVRFLEDVDRRILRIGETTAVIAFATDRVVFGASLGDSGACLFGPHGVTDLTENQKRKPLLGSRCAA